LPLICDRAALRRHPRAILATLVAAELTAAFETTMVLTALKTLIQTFGRPIAVGWLVTSYLLVAAGAAAVCGRLGDLYGRRLVLLVALGGAALGSFISAMAPSLEIMILGRALQGIAGAVFPLCLGLVREHLPESKIPVGVGVISGTVVFGTAAGVIVGGMIIDTGNWHNLFVVSCVCAILSFLLVQIFLPSTKRTDAGQPLDMLGGVLFVPAVSGILLAFSNASTWGSDLRFWGLLLSSVLLLAVWARHEQRHPCPLIDVNLLRNRNIAVANACMALAGLSCYQFVQMVMLLLQQPKWTGIGLGLSATAAGAVKLPGSFAMVVIAPWAGHLAGKFGGRMLIIVGMAISAVGWATLGVFNNSVPIVAILTLLCTVGGGLLYVAVPSIIMAEAPMDRTSEATGVSTVVRSVAMAVGAQMLIILLATSTVSAPSQGPATFPSAAAYKLTLIVMAAICVVAMVTSLGLSRRPAAGANNRAVPA